jgi:hypothetical protein
MPCVLPHAEPCTPPAGDAGARSRRRHDAPEGSLRTAVQRSTRPGRPRLSSSLPRRACYTRRAPARSEQIHRVESRASGTLRRGRRVAVEQLPRDGWIGRLLVDRVRDDLGARRRTGRIPCVRRGWCGAATSDDDRSAALGATYVATRLQPGCSRRFVRAGDDCNPPEGRLQNRRLRNQASAWLQSSCRAGGLRLQPA